MRGNESSVFGETYLNLLEKEKMMTQPWANKPHRVLFEDNTTIEVVVLNGDYVYFQTYSKVGRQFTPTANYGCTKVDMRAVFDLLKKGA